MPLSTDTSMAIPTGPKGDSMNHVAGVRCTICGRVMPYQEQMTCPHCGEKGILDILFDYDYIKKDFTKKSLAENSLQKQTESLLKAMLTTHRTLSF